MCVDRNYEIKCSSQKGFSYSKCILSQVPWIKQSLQSEIRDATLYKVCWGGSEIRFFFSHITKLIHVDIHLWGTRTGCCPPVTLPYHVSVLDQKQSRVRARWRRALCPMIFLISNKNVVFETSIDRGYLRVPQLHFTVNDAKEGWTL